MQISNGPVVKYIRERLGLSQARFAELTGIPQHAISAFELDKASLSASQLAHIEQAVADTGKVAALANRKKRYQAHVYDRIEHDPVRIARHVQTPGNLEYLELLSELHSRRVAAKHTALSLFSGCGGMSLGFNWAGFDIKGSVELNANLKAIYQANFPSSIDLGGDISTFKSTAIEQALRKIGDVDLIIGGPPCQGFSLSGKRDVNDPRNSLFFHYLRFVDVFRPKVAVLENVRLLTSMKSPDGSLVRDQIVHEFAARGYRASLHEVNAKDYGVPQHRERAFFVATRLDLNVKPLFPIPKHGKNGPNLFDGLSPCRTFADACSDLPFLESGEQSADPLHAAVSHPKHNIEWLWDVAEGCSAHDNTDPALRPPSGYNTTYKRQVWSEPGATVQTTFGMISGCRNVHPVATRALTIREAARLQSFPDDFVFKGTLGAIRTGIGNAVPPLLAYQIASSIASELL